MNETIRITMYRFFVRGIITPREWSVWCNRYMHNVILTNPEVVTIFTRMREN